MIRYLALAAVLVAGPAWADPCPGSQLGDLTFCYPTTLSSDLMREGQPWSGPAMLPPVQDDLQHAQAICAPHWKPHLFQAGCMMRDSWDDDWKDLCESVTRRAEAADTAAKVKAEAPDKAFLKHFLETTP